MKMKIAALFSGGKDSTFSIYNTMKQGHEVVCLVSMHPLQDDSILFHHPTHNLLNKISEALEIPIIEGHCKYNNKENEVQLLLSTIEKACELYSIDGLVNGVISSNFQLQIFQSICNKLNLSLYSPLWKIDPQIYYERLFDLNFQILITRVAALGLDHKWLGQLLDRSNFEELKKLSQKYKFNLSFEGGEAETLVLDCPIYRKKIKIKRSNKKWDGVRGTFEILDIDLIQRRQSCLII